MDYYRTLLAAFIKGNCINQLPDDLKDIKIDSVRENELTKLIETAEKEKLRIHKFKKSAALPRVKKVLGIIKGIYPQNLLDIGSGRGTFLWPLLESEPQLKVSAIDILEERYQGLKAVQIGGYNNLNSFKMSVESLDFNDNSFEVVTALEVLEHLQNPKTAINELFRVARNYLIISVPSKEDNNPEHLHLITEQRLKEYLNDYKIKKIEFQYVLNHMIAVVKK